MEILDRNRVQAVKRAFSTRRVPIEAIKALSLRTEAPKAGDLVLARVAEIGWHKRIELPSGRRAFLAPGDEVLLAYGDRYAPDQYEAHVPKDLSPCHMVAAGGIAGQATVWHDRLSAPTRIEPLGLIAGCDGVPLNLAEFAISDTGHGTPDYVFAVFGTSMNAGKTTTAAGLVKGLTAAGYRVGAAKITGTGAGGDLWLMRDYGAVEALDFTDAGFATTYRVDPDRIVEASTRLLGALDQAGCDVAVLEIADGLFQGETAALADSRRLRAMLSGTFFAAGDAMGATAGAAHLRKLHHRVLGISGAVTCSPLAMKEIGGKASAPVLTFDQITDPGVASGWLPQRTSFQASGT